MDDDSFGDGCLKRKWLGIARQGREADEVMKKLKKVKRSKCLRQQKKNMSRGQPGNSS